MPEIIRSRTGPAGELKISKTVLNRVLDGGQAILSKDLAQEFPDSASISDGKIRSLMCVPLFDTERKTAGIVQIDTRDGRGRFEQDDLDLLAAVASQISVAVQNAQLHKALVKQREMEHELQFARQVMQSLLPERPASVPGYDFWAYYEPARHVGGDYYGIIPIAEHDRQHQQDVARWAIAVGDVVGKGMPAALLTAKLSAEVRMFLRGNPTPVRVVELLNHQFEDGGLLDLYITFLLVVLDVNQHCLSVVNAGHPGPLVRRRDGRLEEIGRGMSGLPLAIMPGYRYEMAETTLEPGETVILYTDGVTDAMNGAGERIGETAFRQAIGRSGPGAEAVGEAVVKAVQRHVADHPQFDDITLVCLAPVNRYSSPNITRQKAWTSGPIPLAPSAAIPTQRASEGTHADAGSDSRHSSLRVGLIGHPPRTPSDANRRQAGLACRLCQRQYQPNARARGTHAGAASDSRHPSGAGSIWHLDQQPRSCSASTVDI